MIDISNPPEYASTTLWTSTADILGVFLGEAEFGFLGESHFPCALIRQHAVAARPNAGHVR